jgi:hypothetical protein
MAARESLELKVEVRILGGKPSRERTAMIDERPAHWKCKDCSVSWFGMGICWNCGKRVGKKSKTGINLVDNEPYLPDQLVDDGR